MSNSTRFILTGLMLVMSACVMGPEFTGDEESVEPNTPGVFIEHEQLNEPGVDEPAGQQHDETGDEHETPPAPDGPIDPNQPKCETPGPDSPTLCGNSDEKGHGSPQPLVPTDDNAQERDEE